MRRPLNPAPWLLVVVTAFPLYWLLLASVSPESALFGEVALWPREVGLEHYRALFAERDFWTPMRNSLVVAGSTTALCVLIGTPAAYALARLDFPGKVPILILVLIVTMFPQITIVSPLFFLLRSVGLIDTYGGLILPYVGFAMPLSIWLLTSFFRQFPRDLEEAALLDGATRWDAFRRVVLPLAAPGLAAAAILTFVFSWNEFLFALSFTAGPERQTLPVAIALFRGQHQVPWGQILAAAVITAVPAGVMVLLAQRGIVQGLAHGAVKG